MKTLRERLTVGLPFDFTNTYYSKHSPDETYRVIEIDYQRNGVSGEGFHVVRFYHLNSGAQFIATVFEDAKYIAVVNPLNLTDHFRGDNFETGLRAAIAAWNEEVYR